MHAEPPSRIERRDPFPTPSPSLPPSSHPASAHLSDRIAPKTGRGRGCVAKPAPIGAQVSRAHRRIRLCSRVDPPADGLHILGECLHLSARHPSHALQSPLRHRHSSPDGTRLRTAAGTRGYASELKRTACVPLSPYLSYQRYPPESPAPCSDPGRRQIRPSTTRESTERKS